MSKIVGLEHERYIDLTAEDQPGWLDFFLLKRANLFIGTNSGPASVANIFETDCLLTNWFPLNVNIPNVKKNSFIMPKLLHHGGQWVPLDRMLEDPWGTRELIGGTSARDDPILIENQSDDIRAAIDEIRQRQQGNFVFKRKTLSIERKINSIWNRHIPWDLNIPHSFLRTHATALLRRT